MYLVVLDRFFDGSSANNSPEKTNKNRLTFFHGGDLKGLTQRLNYLQQLGVTALWITPLYQQVGRVGDSYGYHGYWFEDPFRIDPQFGTEGDFRAFLREAKRRGFKVILDMVVNHAGYEAKLKRQQPEWFHSAADPQNEESGELAGLPDFRQENPLVAEYLKRTVKHWIDTYPIDGMRMDTVKHVPHAFWRDLIREVDSGVGMKNGVGRPDLFWVGEVLDWNPAKLDSYLEDGFESLFDFPLQGAIQEVVGRGANTNLLASTVERSLHRSSPKLMTTLLDNHDIPRFVSRLGLPPKETRERLWLAYTLLMTLPGIPQIYYGDEIGMLGSGDPENRRSMPLWAFDPVQRSHEVGGQGFCLPNPASTFAYLSQLIRLRKTHPSLSVGRYQELWRQNGNAESVFAYLRSDESDPIIVVLNCGSENTKPLRIPLGSLTRKERELLTSGALMDDLLGGEGARLEGEYLVVELEGRSVKVLAPRRFVAGMTEAVFQAEVEASDEEEVAIAGSVPELGMWNPKRALRLQRVGGTWTQSLHFLKSGTKLEFKIIKLDRKTGEVRWQAGANRRATLTSEPKTTLVVRW
jgi:glycosidase